MKLSLDTETEELAELRAAIAIIEDALKRRENGGDVPSEEPRVSEEVNSPEVENTFEQQSNLNGNEQAPEVNHTEPPSAVDLSPLSTSDFGETNENRSLEGLSAPETNEAASDNKDVVKEVINSLKNQNPGKPVYMQDIVDKAKEKSVSEEETRNLVNELQSSGEI
tara:strand:- start:25 stop:522 length:498 start_codon:yes stop_codon:yes gene_type:complete